MLLTTITFLVFIVTFIYVVTSTIIDYSKKRKKTKNPFVSFIIPTYNDCRYIEKTIKGIYDSYEKKYFEMVIINDCSTDGTLDVLKRLRKSYEFRLICNRNNLGKSKSINNAFNHTKGEIVFIVDSDTILNKKAMDDVLVRLEDKKVGAVSCRYRPINKGFWAKMQLIEYGMLSNMQTAYNPFSTLSLWGGCMAVKRSVFAKAGMFSPNALSEDMDMALKIGELGLKAQECKFAVYTLVPENPKTMYKQKIRWSSGAMQNYIKHFRFFINHPIAPVFMITYAALTILFIIALINNISHFGNFIILFESFRETSRSIVTAWGLTKLKLGMGLTQTLAVYIIYPLFSLPYLIINYPHLNKKLHAVLLIIPYSIIYFPIYSIVNLIGFGIAIKKYKTLRREKRAW